MSIAIKVRQVQKVFEQLEIETKNLQLKTGITCLTGCGHCCNKPDIEASVLEFLPFAFHAYLRKETDLIKQQLIENQGQICMLFNAHSTTAFSSYLRGNCTQYSHRGLICRLFGYATVRNKIGVKQLSTCKWIKNTYPVELKEIQPYIDNNQVPNYLSYFQKLVQVDFRLGQEFHPINKSMLRALEEVEHYYQYRPFPYRHRKIA